MRQNVRDVFATEAALPPFGGIDVPMWLICGLMQPYIGAFNVSGTHVFTDAFSARGQKCLFARHGDWIYSALLLFAGALPQ
jgi:hypothetical protein